MPRKRKTQDMSPTTVLRWQKVYLIESMKMIADGRLYPEEGKRVVKGLRYTIKALEDSYARFKAEERAEAQDEYKDALRRAEAL